MNIEINILELASDLAHERAMEEMIDEGHITDNDGMWTLDQDSEEDGSGECYVYTSEAQDVFNRWYDYYYSKIEECKI